MMTNTTTMTAQIPSAFGMPASACAHTVRTGVIAVAPAYVVSQDSSVLRDRKAVIAGDLGLDLATFPGTTAWRPPIS